MSLESATEAVREKVGTDSGLEASVKFDFGEDGVILVDGKSSPNTVTNEDGEADCTVEMTLADFEQMAAGEMDPTSAFMMGRLKVTGDMTVAMKLSTVI